jgi:hypothetical protein
LGPFVRETATSCGEVAATFVDKGRPQIFEDRPHGLLLVPLDSLPDHLEIGFEIGGGDGFLKGITVSAIT